MKNTTLLQALIIALGVASAGYFIGNTHLRSKAYDRYVQVKGLAEREVAADVAIWPLQITLAGNDLSLLQSELKHQKSEVNDFFRSLGFESNEIGLGPTNIIDSKAQQYGGNERREFRYFASSEITVRTNNIDKIQDALDQSLSLVSKGILVSSKNTWQPIEYRFTKLNEIKPEMIEEATMKAKEVAQKFAKDSDSTVGKIKSASQGLFSIQDRDSNTPHIKKVRVVTTVDYLLEN